MSCKSILYAVNQSSEALLTGSVIPMGTTVRRYGQNIAVSGDGALIAGGGYYDVDVTLNITATEPGTITVQLFNDGVAVPGAIASASALANDIVNLSLNGVIRLMCCDSTGTLTLGLTGIGATVTNVSTVIEKL